MADILDEIVASKRDEVEQLKSSKSLEELKDEASVQSHRFREVFAGDDLDLIAEIKPEAPSAGRLTELPAVEIARVYQKEDVAAVSCLTDEPYFGQGLDAIRRIKNVLRKPILRKDFIIDPYQVYRANVIGADAVLLIASVLSPDQLASLYELTEELGMDALVEIHSREELEALPVQPHILGINNRTLEGDFSTDLSVTEQLAPDVPEEVILISESGIHDHEDVNRLRAIDHLDGILVGTALLEGASDSEIVRDRVRRLLGQPVE
jgi:indole-3-glycerol phosphate synthase